MTAFSGVRNSWLMVDRNRSLNLLARSASSLACVRAFSTRRRLRISLVTITL